MFSRTLILLTMPPTPCATCVPGTSRRSSSSASRPPAGLNPDRLLAHGRGRSGLPAVDALDLAGGGIYPQPLDVLEVGAGDTQVAGVDRGGRRVQLAAVVNAGLARVEAIGRN